MIRLPWRRMLRPGVAKPRTDGGPTGGGPRDAASEEPDSPRARVVPGERAAFIASGTRSWQSKMTSLLAAGLMISVGAGMLAWYYAEALSRPAAAGIPAHSPVPEVAGEGMTVPAFGPVAAPRMATIAPSVPSAPSAPATFTPPSSVGRQSPPAATQQLDPLLEPSLDRAPGGLPRGYGAPPQLSPRQQALDRRLSGEVFAGTGSGTSSSFTAAGLAAEPAAALPSGSTQAPMSAIGTGGDGLQTLLHPSVFNTTHAQILPTQRLLLPKGTFIDCTLETAIDSTLPGMTVCVTATDTFGADGTVVLLERGTKLIGQTRGEVHQGDARLFVVWTEARTPSGVVVQLSSPGTDALGRSGLDGTINHHFWQRFGAAALVSTIDGVVQSEVQSSSRGGTVVLDPTASEDVLTDILRGTVNIPPTIRVRNGARIQVLVARDVDFRPVYELEPR